MADVKATPPSLMVARKVKRPLYIVLDPAKVRDVWDLTSSSTRTTFKLVEFSAFVQRDLKAAMQPYFKQVEVIAPGSALPATPHVIADVKVDTVKLHDIPVGNVAYTRIQITWAFALRPNEANDYAFSYAGTSSSSETYPTFEVGAAQMVEAAIGDLLARWTEDNGIVKFMASLGPT